MNFEKALEAMKQGKSVIYKGNKLHYILSVFDDYIVGIDNGYHIEDVAFRSSWLLGDGWEIYEEQLKEPEMTAEHAIENLEKDTEPEHKCNACHCNCSHTGTDTNLQEEMKQALSRKFFELEECSADESTVNSMLNIYNSIFSD